jgi:hypothetical protein
MKQPFYIPGLIVSMALLAGSSCSTNDVDTMPVKNSTHASELRCAKIFDKYLSDLGDTFSYEVVAVEGDTCMVSEIIDQSEDTTSNRLLGNRIFTVNLSNNEVRQFPMR